ncbi:MAG: hypothetical protein ACXITV_04720 [Luteibaculaceae bacterium]
MNAKTWITALLLAVFSLTSYGQPDLDGDDMNAEARDRMKSARAAFITRDINLTEAEAQKFWPIYNEMDAELEKIRMERRNTMRGFRDKEKSFTDEDYKKATKTLFELEEKELAVRKKYTDRFQKAIPAQKVFELERAERNFRRSMLSQMRKGEGPGKGKGYTKDGQPMRGDQEAPQRPVREQKHQYRNN